MVKILLLLAWRNLWRYPRRTLLTAGTVALGLVLLLVTLGLNDGAHLQMIEAAVRNGSGHVLFQAPHYQRLDGLERTLSASQTEQILSWVTGVQEEFGVQGAVRRCFGSGLATSAEGATGVRILGVEPEEERVVSRFADRIREGSFLSHGEKNWVVLGTGVARKLRLGVGDKLVLMGQGAGTSEIQSRLVRVRGIVHTGQEEWDHVLLLATLRFSQEFFQLGEKTHQVALVLEDAGRAEVVVEAARKRFPRVEILTWGEALPELHDFIRLDDASNYLFNFFLFLLIAFMVLNTLLMSVLERTREFSLLDALGLAPGRRFLMVLLEATLLAALACGAGLALGLGAHFYLASHGIRLDLFYSGEMTAAGVTFDPVLYSHLSGQRVVQALFWIFGLTLLLSLLPARKAGRGGQVQLLAG